MRHGRFELGLHTEQEQGEAIDMIMKAHGKGVDAARGRDPVSVAFQIGYLQAILELAKREGAKNVERIAERKRDDLDRRLSELG